MIDFYDICDQCNTEITDNQPIKGFIDGMQVQFCSTRCWYEYDKQWKKDERTTDEN